MTLKKFIVIVIGFVFAFFLIDYTVSIVLSKGLEKYYGLNTDSELAIVGHSHLMLGLDKRKIESSLGVKVAKYTREGVNLAERKIMIEHLLETNQNIKTVILGVDAWSFTDEGLSSNSYKLFFPFMDNESINRYLLTECDGVEFFSKKIIRTSRFNELLIGGALRGYMGNWSNLKQGKVDISKLEEQINRGVYRKIDSKKNSIYILEQILTTFEEKKIKVILLNVPTIDIMIKAQKNKVKQVFEKINALAEQYDNVRFLNMQEPWSHEHELFYDAIHLNPMGQKKITEEVIQYLNDSN
ncbi:SGNH/GDSL hydrolase family protein [Aquimarina agarilytica]|uniref:hypothetical protein n=1 Tax=Aquimarina agarilytica TaxID=1087449 RepID=UPI0012F84FE4|nr:hypothetical protein [Aquimarina agarilytica]